MFKQSRIHLSATQSEQPPVRTPDLWLAPGSPLRSRGDDEDGRPPLHPGPRSRASPFPRLQADFRRGRDFLREDPPVATLPSVSLSPSPRLPPPTPPPPELAWQIPFGAPLPSIRASPAVQPLSLALLWSEASPRDITRQHLWLELPQFNLQAGLSAWGGWALKPPPLAKGRRDPERAEGAGEAASKQKSELDRPALPRVAFDRLPSLRCGR